MFGFIRMIRELLTYEHAPADKLDEAFETHDAICVERQVVQESFKRTVRARNGTARITATYMKAVTEEDGLEAPPAD